MASNDFATLEVDVIKGAPSRLLIEIALRPDFTLSAFARDPDEARRAIRDGFRDALTEVDFERLSRRPNPPRSWARQWAGRTFAFAFAAAIGAGATVLLGAAHVPRSYAVGSLAPTESAPPSEVARPDSQSTGAPAARAAPAAGPAKFGLG